MSDIDEDLFETYIPVEYRGVNFLVGLPYEGTQEIRIKGIRYSLGWFGDIKPDQFSENYPVALKTQVGEELMRLSALPNRTTIHLTEDMVGRDFEIKWGTDSTPGEPDYERGDWKTETVFTYVDDIFVSGVSSVDGKRTSVYSLITSDFIEWLEEEETERQEKEQEE